MRLRCCTLLIAVSCIEAQPLPFEPLEVAKRFADHMLEHGRDRYGKVHSPLFSNSLTREARPRLTPYPLFAASDPKLAEKRRLEKRPDLRQQYPGVTFTRFLEHDFNRCTNYPAGLEDAGPHKVTVYGTDPFEDRDLYVLLFELTARTGDLKYGREANRALEWWFTNTQSSTTGLYPWGEHMGWDLEHDMPTYFEGPSKLLYHSAFHEVKDEVPFLNILARFPDRLERYAMGVWERHFWDKERAFYCRHGDYTGEDNRLGSALGFPAHLGAYLDIWSAALARGRSEEVRGRLTAIVHKVLDMAIARSQKHGFFPFTFEPELYGTAAREDVQARRLGLQSMRIAKRLEPVNPDLAAKLRKLGELNRGAAPGGKPRRNRTDLAREKMSPPWADQILHNVEAGRTEEARNLAAEAYGLFWDSKSPLPRALARGTPGETPDGQPFPDFYFRGARLMRAFLALAQVRHLKG